MQRNPAIEAAKATLLKEQDQLYKKVQKIDGIKKAIQMCTDHKVHANNIYNQELKDYVNVQLDDQIKRMNKLLLSCEKAKEKLKKIDDLFHQL